MKWSGRNICCIMYCVYVYYTNKRGSAYSRFFLKSLLVMCLGWPPTPQSISSPGKVIFLSVSIGNMWDLEMLSCEYYDPYESKSCKNSGSCMSWTARSTSQSGFNRWENRPFWVTFGLAFINNFIFKNLKVKNMQHHPRQNFKS